MRCPQCNFLVDSRYDRCTRCGHQLILHDKKLPHPSAGDQSLWKMSSGHVAIPPSEQPIERVQFSPALSDRPQLSENLTSGKLKSIQFSPTTSSNSSQRSNPTLSAYLSTFQRGDVLKGRYRLGEAVPLPKNQLSRATMRYATDMQIAKRRVSIQQIKLLDFEDPQMLIKDVTDKFKYASRHSGIAPIIDSFYEKGYCYFVQPAPVGESLATIMQQQGGALPESFVIAYGRQLCEIVAFLEKGPQPIIHGAISPQTIMIDQGKNRVALLYLPILSPSVRPEYNPTGYIPPEQARGQIVSSSDLYAIAATMHHAVTGYSPHDRLAHFYPPARRLNPRVTASLEEILARQLRLSIKQRYPDAQSMLNDLSKLSASYSLKIEEKPLEPIIQTASRRISIWSLFQTKPVLAFSLVLLCLILVSAIAVVGISTYTVQAQQTDYTQQLHTELDSFNKQGIGISDGRLVFDTYKGRLDSTLKMEAASAIQTANMSAAVNLLSQAVSADPIDGEALIYNEDMHIFQTNAPYVTIVVGLPIDDSDEHLTSARVQLQAIYLAQHETNTQHLLPNGLKLRILIANSGKDNNNVATVAQFVANRVSLDGNPDHIITVVGWPYSSQTVNARDILAGVHIPLVSQTASSVQLSGSSPYFFRVCPVDDMQGQALGSLIAHDMNVKKLLVLHDPTDPYSSSLADAVAGSAQSLGATISTGTFTETQTTVDQYQQFANQVVNEHDDAIFLAGLSVDGIRLAHAIGNASRDNPHNKVLHSLKIIGGDGLTHAGLFGGGNNADAEIVRTFPQDMRRITATEFADAGEWNFLHIGQKQQPFFFSDWSSTYQSSPVGPNATDPTQEGILTYDAVGVVIHATSLSSDTPTGDTIQRILPTLGTGNVAAYQGVSGRIAFDSQGNPIDKAVVVVAVQDNGHNGNELHIQKIIGQFR